MVRRGAQSLWPTFEGLGCRVWGLGSRVQRLGFRDFGFRVFRVDMVRRGAQLQLGV